MALFAAGCGTTAHDRAVEHARGWAASHGDRGRVTCSSGIGGLRPQARTPDFICLVRHSVAVCDELRVRRVKGVWLTALRRRSVDCVLPL